MYKILRIYIIIGAIPASSVCHKFSWPLIGQSCSRQLVPDWLGDVYRLGEVYTVQPVYTGPDPGWPWDICTVSQCTCVHTDTPEEPPSYGWRRNFAFSRWVIRSLRLHKIGHNTVIKRVGIFLAWVLTLQSWARHNQKLCSIIGTSITFAVKYLEQYTTWALWASMSLSSITLSFLNVLYTQSWEFRAQN